MEKPTVDEKVLGNKKQHNIPFRGRVLKNPKPVDEKVLGTQNTNLSQRKRERVLGENLYGIYKCKPVASEYTSENP